MLNYNLKDIRKTLFCLLATLLIIFALGLLVLSSGENTTVHSYYPLQEGLSWTYHWQRKPDQLTGQLIVENYERRKLAGHVVTPQKQKEVAIMMGTKQKRISFLFVTKSSEGFYEVAKQGAEEFEPNVYSSPLPLLKFPIRAGTKWQDKETLKVRGGMWHAEKKLTITMNYEIIKTDLVVTVPAGTFDDCVKVMGKGSKTFTYEDYGEKTGKARYKSSIWLAPGIGVVKEADELSGEGVTEKAKVYYQLKEFSKPKEAGKLPIANAGPDKEISNEEGKEEVSVTLDGRKSVDPDGHITEYTWIRNGEKIASGKKTSLTLPVGTHEIMLEVKDSEGRKDRDVVTVSIKKHVAPAKISLEPTKPSFTSKKGWRACAKPKAVSNTAEKKDKIPEKTVNVLNKRFSQYGIEDSKISLIAGGKIEIVVPGAIDSYVLNQLVSHSGRLSFKKVIKKGAPGTSLSRNNFSQQVLYSRGRKKEERAPYIVQKKPLWTGETVTDVEVKKNLGAKNPIYLLVKFNNEDANKFAAAVEKLEPSRDRIAITLDNVVLSAPIISHPIWDKAKNANSIEKASIQGEFLINEAKLLAILMKSSLPRELEIIEQGYIPIESKRTKENVETAEMDEIEVGDIFYTHIIESTEDSGIEKIRFLSDQEQDGQPTGSWVGWYNWEENFPYVWNSKTKVAQWSFLTTGTREIWAQIKDKTGRTYKTSTQITVVEPT